MFDKGKKENSSSELKNMNIGDVVTGTVTRIFDYGAFVKLDDSDLNGLIHISKISNEYVRNVRDFISEDEKVEVEVININEKNQISFKLIKKI